VVDRLVLACTSSGGAGGASYPLHELDELPETERFAAGLALSDVRRGAEWQAANPGQNPSLAGAAAVMDPWPETEPDTRDIAALGYAYD